MADPPKADALRTMLSGGDHRSLGRAVEVLALVTHRSERLPELVGCLWADDPVVCMRAADVLEKLSRSNAAALLAFKAQLLGLMAETTPIEVRWHLALLLPRLRLTRLERRRVRALLEAYLEDRSSIVRTCAMQGLADLIPQQPEMRSEIVGLLSRLAQSGSPAMRARGRILLEKLEHSSPARG